MNCKVLHASDYGKGIPVGKMTNVQKRNKILRDYEKKYTFILNDDLKNDDAYYLYATKSISMSHDMYYKPNNENLFGWLHEIGHGEYDKSEYPQALSEFLATAWAILHCKKYGVKYTMSIYNLYQPYIDSFCKNSKQKYELQLKKPGAWVCQL